jgi:acyl carrier protein
MTVIASDSYPTLIRAVADVFMIDEQSLSPRTTARDVPGWDSVSQVMLLMRIEDDFGIEIESADLSAAADLGSLAAFLDSRQAESVPAGPAA